MPIRAFIAYDFALLKRGSFRNVLEDAKESGKPDLLIRYPGDSDSPKDHGSLWDTVVGGPIGLADKFLAYIDLPNANVGFEIGFAFGKGKPVGIYRFEAVEHEWLKEPPLRGHIRYHANTTDAIHEAIKNHGFMTLGTPPLGGERVMVLCPKKGGGPYRNQIANEWGWTTPPLSEWTVDKLPDQLQNVGCVVWIITPYDGEDEDRDGTENTALSMIAGFAHAHPEIILHVFMHENARFVADLGHISKRFASNSELKSLLTTVHTEWQAELAKRKASSTPPAACAPADQTIRSKPAYIPPLPRDLFRDTADRFIGRAAQLADGADAVAGMMARFNGSPTTQSGQQKQLIWAYGFGGMGKSWCLQRIRCLAEDAHPQIASLLIDWDKPDWPDAYTSEPKSSADILDAIAIRLCQAVHPDAADPYWQAKDHIANVAREHQNLRSRFDGYLQPSATGTDSSMDHNLARLLRDKDLWHDDLAQRDVKLKPIRDNSHAHRELFRAWCGAMDVNDPAVICPHTHAVKALRDCLRAVMQERPLIVVLDTCEILLDDLHVWLRQLFVPLINGAAPLLLLIGSRLPPDHLKARGSRMGWIAEVSDLVLRSEDFTTMLRFKVAEIEAALHDLQPPVTADHAHLAELLDRVTLGVPLALSALFDLHRQGDDVLANLPTNNDAELELKESDAMNKVIATVSDRLLLNLVGNPQRVGHLHDIITLALLPSPDAAVLQELWRPDKPADRLRQLAQRYTLLASGDLHPTVRSYLRRHWRNPDARPECFDEVLDNLACHTEVVLGTQPADDRRQCPYTLATRLNLRSWQEGVAIIPDLARALCLARVYEADCQTLETLLTELSLLPEADKTLRVLWHGNDGERPTDKALLPWLRSQRQVSRQWTAEEDAALALLEGIQFIDWQASAAEACAAFAKLEEAVKFFGLESLPRRGEAGNAYFSTGRSLDRHVDRRPLVEFDSSALASYERALNLNYQSAVLHNNIAVFYSESSELVQQAVKHYLKAIELDPKLARPHNGLGNRYQDHLQQPEKAELEYLKAIELNPKYANPHHGLGRLYQDHLQRPEKAEREYLKAIELDPKNTNPHNGLGDLYRDHFQQPEKAEQEYLKAIELDPKFANPHNGLGLLYETDGRWQEAVAEYGRDIALDPKSGSGQRGLAWVALLSTGSVKEARRWADEALVIDPKHPGTPLAQIGVDTWAGDWAAVESRFADWMTQLSAADEITPWASRHRLAALLRKAHEAGRLETLAVPLRASAARSCWEPWAQAVDALLLGVPAPSSLEGRAAECYRLLQPPGTGR